MAAPIKRQCEATLESECTVIKKIKKDDGIDEAEVNEIKLKTFLKWCEDSDFKLTSKVPTHF